MNYRFTAISLVTLAVAFIGYFFLSPDQDLGLTHAELEAKLKTSLFLNSSTVFNPPSLTEDEVNNQIAFYSDNYILSQSTALEKFKVFGFNRRKILIEVRLIEIRRGNGGERPKASGK